ncbi:MAG: sulfotransferase [Mariniblastus sp.]|nr:sulfotransferase [Mariniblastus sp.]
METNRVSRPVFIVAQQRSGTNLLRKSLAATPGFRDLDEVFDPKQKQYWHFRKGRVRQQPELATPGREHQIEMFESFLEHRLACPQPHTLIDVKYNSVHSLDDLWLSPMETPVLIEWLVQKQHPVIHLVRENHLENLVSMLVGTESAQWVVNRGDEGPRPVIQFELDPEQTVAQVQRRERELQRFRHYLKRANCIEWEYDHLLDEGGRFSSQLLDHLARRLKLAAAPDPPIVTRKTGRSIFDVVVNLESTIKPALARQGYGSLVRRPASIPRPVDGSGHPLDPAPSNRLRPVTDGSAYRKIPRVSPVIRPDPSPVFVIAMQRSGTNLLRKALANDGSLFDLNEIFDPFHQQYWSYREQMIRDNPDLSVPSSSNQLEVFESFLNHHLHHSPARLIVDVKYNSTHHLNRVWHAPGSRPLLLDWLVEQQCPVIHLVRDNILENYVSNVVAFESRSWVAGAEDSGDTFSTKLNVRETLRKLQIFERQISVFRKWLAPTNCLELTYERLLGSGGQLAEDASRQIREHLGITGHRPFQVKTQKSKRALVDVIENFETDIRPALIQHGYERWLPPARAA